MRSVIPALAGCIFFFLLITETEARLQFAPGIILDTVVCTHDQSESYAIYLPSSYSSDTVWPVLYAFDAAARGRLPLERFRYAAETYGFILICSNNSRNGPWEVIDKATEAVFRDSQRRFRIDTSRMYTTGFSGGARVATAVALRQRNIEGVIGCGAGFAPVYPPDFRINFDYIAVIGTMDFLYHEIQVLEKTLTTLKKRHLIVPYPSGHDWPDSLIAFDALTWHQFRAMEKGTIEPDTHYVRVFLDDFRDRHHAMAYDMVSRLRVEENALNLAGDLIPTGGIRMAMRDIQAKPDYERDVRTHERLFRKEAGLIEDINAAFMEISTKFIAGAATTRDPEWWRLKVNRAERMTNKGRTPADTLFGHRIIDYIWREAWIQYTSGAQSDKTEPLHDLLDIWLIAKPEMWLPNYYKARVYTRELQYSPAVAELAKAVSKGFSAWDFLLKDDELKALHERSDFQELLEGQR